MLSKAQQKSIVSLKLKKNRDREKLFVVEGLKPIKEFIDSTIELHRLYAIEDYFNIEFIEIKPEELSKISQLKTPQKALAVFKIPNNPEAIGDGLILALDAIRDPGNLGTIIRLCDWFGIEDLVCSLDTVNCYNPKVVQATMGSLARINIHYLNLDAFLQDSKLPKYAAMLSGDSIYKINFPKNAILIMGNEAHGISEPILQKVEHQITIPRYQINTAVESLNVATATSICLNEFRRPLLKGKV